MPSCRKSLSIRLSVTRITPGASGKRGHHQAAIRLSADPVRVLPVRGQHDLLVGGGRELVLEDHQVQVPALQLRDAGQVAIPLVLKQLEQVKPDAEPGLVTAWSLGGQLQVLWLALQVAARRRAGRGQGQGAEREEPGPKTEDRA